MCKPKAGVETFSEIQVCGDTTPTAITPPCEITLATPLRNDSFEPEALWLEMANTEVLVRAFEPPPPVIDV